MKPFAAIIVVLAFTFLGSAASADKKRRKKASTTRLNKGTNAWLNANIKGWGSPSHLKGTTHTFGNKPKVCSYRRNSASRGGFHRKVTFDLKKMKLAAVTAQTCHKSAITCIAISQLTADLHECSMRLGRGLSYKKCAGVKKVKTYLFLRKLWHKGGRERAVRLVRVIRQLIRLCGSKAAKPDGLLEGDPGDQPEGDPDGVEGGVTGGVPGGVVGGGVGGSVPAPPPPSPPKIVLQHVLEQQRISGKKRVFPDDADKLKMRRDDKWQVIASLKMCLTPQGTVSRVRAVRNSGYPNYDAKILAAIRLWRYRPFKVNGKAVPVCTSVTFVYRQ